MTMSLIQTVTVGSGGAASIEFTSIPQDGTDLVLLTSIRTGRADFLLDVISARFNGVTTGYLLMRLQGSGSSATTFSGGNNFPILANGNTSTASTFGSGSVTIANYTSSTNKSYSSDSVGENNATESYQQIAAMSFESSSAITSLTLLSGTSNTLLEHSTASLYKITKGSDGIVTTS